MPIHSLLAKKKMIAPSKNFVSSTMVLHSRSWKKSDVNGDNTNEVFQWLKNQKSGLLELTQIKVHFQNLACKNENSCTDLIPSGIPCWQKMRMLGVCYNTWSYRPPDCKRLDGDQRGSKSRIVGGWILMSYWCIFSYLTRSPPNFYESQRATHNTRNSKHIRRSGLWAVWPDNLTVQRCADDRKKTTKTTRADHESVTLKLLSMHKLLL